MKKNCLILSALEPMIGIDIGSNTLFRSIYGGRMHTIDDALTLIQVVFIAYQLTYLQLNKNIFQ